MSSGGSVCVCIVVVSNNYKCMYGGGGELESVVVWRVRGTAGNYPSLIEY